MTLNTPTITVANQLNFTFTLGNGIASVVLKQGTTSGTYPTTTTCTSSPCVISGLTGGTSYYYRLEALDHQSVAVNSSEVLGIPLGGATTVNSPTQASSTSTSISWSTVAGATGYVVDYGTSTGNYTSSLAETSSTSATITGLGIGTPTFIRVCAKNAYGVLVSTEVVFRSIGAFTLNAITLSAASQLTLSWSVPTGATSVSINYGTTSGTHN
ncbi:MAG: fibronectin type III domain-containing protein, partial [Hyphomonas sp.]|nr:fibronectin type III domain-containing protein [Hyphomonas sp.]